VRPGGGRTPLSERLQPVRISVRKLLIYLSARTKQEFVRDPWLQLCRLASTNKIRRAH